MTDVKQIHNKALYFHVNLSETCLMIEWCKNLLLSHVNRNNFINVSKMYKIVNKHILTDIFYKKNTKKSRPKNDFIDYQILFIFLLPYLVRSIINKNLICIVFSRIWLQGHTEMYHFVL